MVPGLPAPDDRRAVNPARTAEFCASRPKKTIKFRRFAGITLSISPAFFRCCDGSPGTPQYYRRKKKEKKKKKKRRKRKKKKRKRKRKRKKEKGKIM